MYKSLFIDVSAQKEGLEVIVTYSIAYCVTLDYNHIMKIEFDEEKERHNIQTRGLSFSTAALVFADPDRIEFFDDRGYGEDRWAVIGLVEDILTVIYTVREDDNVYRIISARKATKKERRIYENYGNEDY